jgi:hypothetical protein
LTGSFTSQGHNLIGQTDGADGLSNGFDGDITGTTTLPLNPRLGSLQDNGGLTFTMALLYGSPAIDQGSSGLTTDQRGKPRPVDKGAVMNAVGGDASDIGAYEVQREEFSLTRLERDAGNVLVSFDTEVGLSYRLERSNDLLPGTWTVVADPVPGTGSTVQVIDSGGAGQPKRFYRGRTVP